MYQSQVERPRELQCLYAVTTLVSPTGVPVEELIEAVVEVIPSGWTHAEDACARVVCDGREWRSREWCDPTVRQSVGLLVEGRRAGVVEVGYRSEHAAADEGPFLHEERTLLTLIARVIGEAVARAERNEALKSAEMRFRALIENALDTLLVLESGGHIRFGTPSSECALGYFRGALKGTSIFDLMHPDDEHVVRTLLERAEQPGYVSPRVELRLRRRDGDWRIFEAVGVSLIGNPAVRGILVNARDITERRRDERLLARSEQRFRSLFDHNPHPVYEFDLDGRFIAANPACEALLGLSLPELLEKRFQELIAPEHLAEAERIFQRVLTGVAETYELAVITAAGRRELRGVSGPVIVDGKVVGAFGMAEDISERRRLEEQLRHAQKMEAIGRMAGGVAHDFNNLLTAISGHAELVHEQLQGSGAVIEDVDEIRKAADRAASLTRQLLAFSRQEVVEPQLLDLNAVVTDVERMLRRLIGEHIQLRTRLEANLPRIRADPGQLQQILLNLVVNARDAMPEGGTLSIETGLTSPRFGLDARRVAGEFVRLSVRDTGAGMSRDVLSRIFEPFFTTKEAGKGTGLGLSTVYGIVQQSRARIEVESEPGAGTTFIVHFPAAEAPGGRGPADERTATILLVEDEETVRTLALRVLLRQGFRVLAARTGTEAVQVARDNPGEIDLLLTDVVMPGLSGIETAEQILVLRPRCQVLFMSGYAEDDLLRRGGIHGRAGFLQKPFTTEGLAEAVRRALGRAAP